MNSNIFKQFFTINLNRNIFIESKLTHNATISRIADSIILWTNLAKITSKLLSFQILVEPEIFYKNISLSILVVPKVSQYITGLFV